MDVGDLGVLSDRRAAADRQNHGISVDVLTKEMAFGAVGELRDHRLVHLLRPLGFSGAVVDEAEIALHATGGGDMGSEILQAAQVRDLGHTVARGQDPQHHRGLGNRRFADREARMLAAVDDQHPGAACRQDGGQDGASQARAQDGHVEKSFRTRRARHLNRSLAGCCPGWCAAS